MNVRVVPVKARRLVIGKDDVVLKRLACVDESLDDLISVAGGRSVGAMIVDIERVEMHIPAGGAAIRRVELHHEAFVGSVVGDGDDQMVAGFYV